MVPYQTGTGIIPSSQIKPVAARFTLDGSEALEAHLAQTCRHVLSGVQGVIPAVELEGLVLGGGYGRGQGGVLRTAAGDSPYNDLEFYVFVRGNILLAERRYRAALQALGERLTPEAGLHVEFKVYSVEKLRRSPVSMFTYDLATGHKIIFGDEGWFRGCEHHLAAEQIPASEATRLLFNRCSGLLLAKDFLRQAALTAEQSDFIGRNLAKAQLALGDAVLAALGHYHWDCRERNARFRQLKLLQPPPWLAEVRRHHACGIEFKLHPHRAINSHAGHAKQLEEMSALGRQLWLWLESRRLHREFSSARDYALAGLSKCPETAAWRNGALNLRAFGLRALWGGNIFRFPRERLFNALCLLLWDDRALNEPALVRRLKSELHTTTGEWPDLIRAYQNIWQNYG